MIPLVHIDQIATGAVVNGEDGIRQQTPPVGGSQLL
jgi:hypothetical protein